MNLSRGELDKLPLLSIGNDNQGGVIYIKDNSTLYKIINDNTFFQDELIRNIDFQLNNCIPNTPKIYDKIYIDNVFSGYSMQYLNDSITFKMAIGKDINRLNKINAIIDIYKAIKYLHSKDIFLGDIHLDNLLISNDGNGYIVDLDYLVFSDDFFKFSQLYLVRLSNKNYKINLPSMYTDNIKAMLCSISLLLNINLEDYIDMYSHDINIESIYYKIIKGINNKRLNNYFIRLIRGDDTIYFDDFILNNKNKAKRLVRTN